MAITVNFLQPLAHAAMVREGASPLLWSVFCRAAVAESPSGDGAGKDSRPVPVAAHDCCLGLAHAAPLASPSATFTSLVPIAATAKPLSAPDRSVPVGIRDGPNRLRGPPLPV
ncbi:MAG TPA: DUF2946 family protein [Reyranella sp.]|nr:DUF2946 family protein [Reyranella sp.]